MTAQAIRKQTALWTTKNGTKLRICDMGDSHLVNAIKLCQRKAASELTEEIGAAYGVLAGLNGEMAQFYCEQDIARMEESHPDDFLESFPLFEKLCLEAERRGINPHNL